MTVLKTLGLLAALFLAPQSAHALLPAGTSVDPVYVRCSTPTISTPGGVPIGIADDPMFLSCDTGTVTGMFVSKTGDTMTGPLVVSTSGASVFAITASSTVRLLAGGIRWADGTTSTTAFSQAGGAFVLKAGDTMTGDLVIVSSLTVTGTGKIRGSTDYGSVTNAQLQALACPTLPCEANSTTDFDKYTATGTAVSQWRSQRTGLGPQ